MYGDGWSAYERRAKAVEWLEAHARFNMKIWADTDPEADLTICDTPACIAGVIALRLEAEDWHVDLKSTLDISTTARAWLKLDMLPSEDLFLARHAPKEISQITLPDAIMAMKWLRDTGDVNWQVIAG